MCALVTGVQTCALPSSAAFEAAWWLDERLGAWLSEPSATDTLTLSAPGNVTSEMGLALLDVADAIRPHPAVVAYLQTLADDDFLDELADPDRGPAAREAIATGRAPCGERGWRDVYSAR